MFTFVRMLMKFDAKTEMKKINRIKERQPPQIVSYAG